MTGERSQLCWELQKPFRVAAREVSTRRVRRGVRIGVGRRVDAYGERASRGLRARARLEKIEGPERALSSAD